MLAVPKLWTKGGTKSAKGGTKSARRGTKSAKGGTKSARRGTKSAKGVNSVPPLTIPFHFWHKKSLKTQAEKSVKARKPQYYCGFHCINLTVCFWHPALKMIQNGIIQTISQNIYLSAKLITFSQNSYFSAKNF